MHILNIYLLFRSITKDDFLTHLFLMRMRDGSMNLKRYYYCIYYFNCYLLLYHYLRRKECMLFMGTEILQLIIIIRE